ncbi:hypothetical protein AUF12_16465 [Enterococcus avium]|uniref:hypothetical protein n=1 Tax=Enterococcus avium TaxID=33945 RepID=UPI000C998843|nr:hypothetical protein [Enterococcus avium]PNE48970.1 hypothetical protein AUF12_16465 [Enterococcus avium]
MKLDLSFTITAIIALCALITPLLTTYLNNSHQRKLRELEFHQQEQTQDFLYVREKWIAISKQLGNLLEVAQPSIKLLSKKLIFFIAYHSN